MTSYKDIYRQMSRFKDEKLNEINELDAKVESEIIYTEFKGLHKVTSNLYKNEVEIVFKDATKVEFRPETNSILFSSKAIYNVDRVRFLVECNDNIIQPIYRGDSNE